MAVRRTQTTSFATITLILMVLVSVDAASDNNGQYSPCGDTTVARSDGFSLGFAFAGKTSFYFNTTQQLSPCDSRLGLSSSNSLFALFRPKVDEISLLTVNSTNSLVSSLSLSLSLRFAFSLGFKLCVWNGRLQFVLFLTFDFVEQTLPY